MQISIIRKNLGYSILNYIVVNVLKFIVRFVFIRALTVEYLGLNGLFSNILTFLSLAELGVGPAIVYSLYKPLAVNDKETVKSIMSIFKKVYVIVGYVILFLGVCLYPFLDFLVKEHPSINDWQYFYLVFLVNTAISYFWSYQRNLLVADQKQFIVNIYQAVVQIFIAILQILLLILFENYWFYLFAMILGTIVENLAITSKSYSYYPYLKERSEPLQSSIKKEILSNTKAMLIHKFAGIIVFSSSSIILSKFIGITMVGIYSNYTLVTTALSALTGKLFEAVTATIGNSIVTDSLEKKQNFFQKTQLITAWLTSVMTVGIYVLINPFVELWLGKEYLLDDTTVALFVFSFYLSSMRRNVLMYRDACGLFMQDRYKAIIETIINIFACIYLTEIYGIQGLISGTIISTILTCLWLEPYILFRYELKLSLKRYFINYVGYMFITYFAIVICNYFVSLLPKGYGYFVLECISISVFVTALWGMACWKEWSLKSKDNGLLF